MILQPVLSNVLVDSEERSFGKFLPSELPGLKLWTRYNQGITVAGTGVSQWDDQSGNDNHLLQADNAKRGSHQANGAIRFNGVDEWLKTGAFTLVQPETVYLLFKQVAWVANDRIFDGFADNGGTVYMSATSPDIKMYAGTPVGGPNSDMVVGEFAALVTILNGSNSLFQVNNGTPTNVTTGTNGLGGFTLAAGGNIASTNKSLIEVKEVAIFDSSHDAVDRAKMANYLAKVGGLLF